MRTGVYGLFCVENNKLYVGSCSRERYGLNNRITTHFYELDKGTHANPHLQNTFNKYGAASFLTFIIEYVPEANCLIREQFYIDTLAPEFNIAKFATSGMKGRKHSAETKAKWSAMRKGRKATEQTKQKMRESSPKLMLGIVMPLETRLKIVAAHGCGPIFCPELNTEFYSMSEAARKCGVFVSNIHKVLNGSRKSTGGFTFKRVLAQAV